MFTIHDYWGHIRTKGLARTNRFAVIVTLPGALGSPENSRILSLMCNQTELPSKTINISETKYNGEILKHAVGKSYFQQQFVFNVSSDMMEKDIIDNWGELMINEDHELSYYDDYIGTIEVYQLDTNGQPTHAIKFLECFPITTSPMTVSHSDPNAHHQLMVQFAYRKWETILSTSNVKNDAVKPGPVIPKGIRSPAANRGEMYFVDEMDRNLNDITNLIDGMIDEFVTDEARDVARTVERILKNTTAMDSNTSIGDLQEIQAKKKIPNLFENKQISDLINTSIVTIDSTGSSQAKNIFSNLT